MTCEETEVLLHALLDNELDAGHAREVEAHVAACRRCAAQLRDFRALRAKMAGADLCFSAPASLRARLEPRRAADVVPMPAPSRRTLLKGFAFGSMASAAIAATVVLAVIRSDQEDRVLGEVVSAHLRSLQADHLTDVQTSDQHTVKPWFNGRLDVAPPVPELTAQGFTLIGGRLDYVDGRGVAAIVYRRRNHVINLFVAQGGTAERRARTHGVQGFNVKSWTDHGLSFWAVSDINAEELQEFADKFQSAIRAS
jgi:anti-sigma factor RsiW